MEIVKLSSKGQIVIPKSIRDDLHLPPGTEFVISASATGLSLTPKTIFPATKLSEVRGVLSRKGQQALGEDDIKARLRARAKANDIASKR